MVSALVLGDRNTIKKTGISKSFLRCGASHILAVSGLHVGIVVAMLSILFNCIEWVIGRPKWARYVKVVLLLSALWCYAFIAGLAASIVRSAIMFTIYYVVRTLFRRLTDSQSVVSLTALCMLVYNPCYLFDIGFQYTFTAVASIIMFMRYTNPIVWYESLLVMLSRRFVGVREYVYKRSSRRAAFLAQVREDRFPFVLLPKMIIRGLFRYLAAMVCVSLAAQIMMTPLVAYYFQNFAISTLVSSLIAIPIATFLIPASCLFLVSASISSDCLVTDLLASIVSFLSRIMLDVMETIAEWECLQITDIPFSLADLLITLSILILIYFFLSSRNLWLVFASAISIIAYTFFSIFEINGQREASFVAVYNISQTSAIHIRDSRRNLLITNNADRVAQRVGGYWVRERIDIPAVIDSITNFRVDDSLYYILSKPLPIASDSVKRLKVNTLIVQKNSVKDYELMQKYFDYEHLVIDGTNYKKNSRMWRDIRDSLGIDCHITMYDGTYIHYLK